jgi:hypothetical protein
MCVFFVPSLPSCHHFPFLMCALFPFLSSGDNFPFFTVWFVPLVIVPLFFNVLFFSCHHPSFFASMFAHEIAAFNDGAGIASVVFAIGRALSGQVNESEKTIFGETESVIKFERIIGPVKQAIAFYEAQIIACRRAVACWTLVGIRFHVVKDIRKLIGGLIWDSRSEARHQVVVEKFVPIENSSDDDSSTHSPVSSSDSD